MIEKILSLGIWYNLVHIFIIVTTITIGFVAYINDPKDPSHRSFFFLNLMGAVWTCSMYVSNFLFLPHDLLVLINRSTFSIAFLLLIAYFYFCWVFPQKTWYSPLINYVVILVSLVGAVISIVTDLVHKDLILNASRTKITYAADGILFPYIVLLYGLMAIGSTYILVSKLKVVKGKKRTQLQYELLGSISFIVFIFATDLIPSFFNYNQLSVFGAFGFLPFISFTGYAIIKHRLMDIELVIKRSAVYATLLSIIFVFYVALIVGLKKYSEAFLRQDTVFIIASFAVALGFQPLKRWFDGYADEIFSKGQYDFESLLKKIGVILGSSLVVENLANDLTDILKKELKITKTAFFLEGDCQKIDGFIYSREYKRKLLAFFKKDKVIVAEELAENTKLRKILDRADIKIILFFCDETENAKGFLTLCSKISGNLYSARDIHLLEIIAPQISITIRNINQQKIMIEQVLEERQRIDRDAHDVVYNKLGALAKKAEAAFINPSEAESTLKLLKEDLRKAVTDLQKIVSGETETDNTSIIVKEELEKICKDFKGNSRVNLHYNFDDTSIINLKPQHYWHIQCILEESLNNIRKHSEAKNAMISLSRNNGHVVMNIKDNGVGFDPDCEYEGRGLIGMKQRAEKMGAQIQFITNRKGASIRLLIPSSK